MDREQIAQELVRFAKALTGADKALALEAGKALVKIIQEDYTTSEPEWNKEEVNSLKVTSLSSDFDGDSTGTVEATFMSTIDFSKVQGYTGKSNIKYTLSFKAEHLNG